MTYERLGAPPLDYQPCRYRGSKLLFRGPKRRLDGEYVACLGGTDTYGKFIETPYPALLERMTGLDCVNLGWPNAGVDVLLQDAGLISAASKAQMTILQLPCAQNMSNRFFTVHPRRNDRFIKALGPLKAVFPGVDFTEFHFTRHLLSRLQQVSGERFAQVRAELQALWVARLRLLLQKIGGPVVLLWFSARRPGQAGDCPDLAQEPAFVTRDMLNDLKPLALQQVEVVASAEAKAAGTRGMLFSEPEAAAAGELLGPMAHEEAAAALAPVIAAHVGA